MMLPCFVLLGFNFLCHTANAIFTRQIGRSSVLWTPTRTGQASSNVYTTPGKDRHLVSHVLSKGAVVGRLVSLGLYHRVTWNLIQASIRKSATPALGGTPPGSQQPTPRVCVCQVVGPDPQVLLVVTWGQQSCARMRGCGGRHSSAGSKPLLNGGHRRGL